MKGLENCHLVNSEAKVYQLMSKRIYQRCCVGSRYAAETSECKMFSRKMSSWCQKESIRDVAWVLDTLLKLLNVKCLVEKWAKVNKVRLILRGGADFPCWGRSISPWDNFLGSNFLRAIFREKFSGASFPWAFFQTTELGQNRKL